MTGAQGTLTTPASNARCGDGGAHGARSAESRSYRDAGVIVCVHDNPATGELSLVGDGRDEAVLAIRRTGEGLTRAELIATVERLGAGKVAALVGVTSSTPVVAIGSFVLDLQDPPLDDHEGAPGQTSHADRRLRSGEPIGGSRRGLVMCRDHDTSPLARGEAPVAAGVVEPTERAQPSSGCERRGRGACPREPGLTLPPGSFGSPQRTGAPLSAAHTARVLGRWAGSGSTVARHAFVSVRLRSGTAGGSA